MLEYILHKFDALSEQAAILIPFFFFLIEGQLYNKIKLSVRFAMRSHHLVLLLFIALA